MDRSRCRISNRCANTGICGEMAEVCKWKYPPDFSGGYFVNGCSAVSYFSTLLGSIIGAGWLSFRVRDGSGRFPAAMAAVTLFRCVHLCIVCGGGVQ